MSIEKTIQNVAEKTTENLADQIAEWTTGDDVTNMGVTALDNLMNLPEDTITEMVEDIHADALLEATDEDKHVLVTLYMGAVDAAMGEVMRMMNE